MTIGTLGLDNIAVAFALGPLRLGRRRIALLGIIFATTEVGMALLGATAGDVIVPSAATATEATRAIVLSTMAVALIGLAWIKYRPATIVASPWALLAMSLLLGIDDFIAARLDQSATVASLIGTGMLTGALAAAACAVSRSLFPLAPRPGAMVSALMLAGLAIAGMA